MQNRQVLIPNIRSEARSRLLIIPHAGGNASQFLPLANSISDSEVVIFDLSGRGFSKEVLQPNWPDLMGEWELSLNQYTDKPFIMLGHSFGATIAFEYLKNNQASITCELIASASLAPTIENLNKIPKTIQLNDEEFLEFLKGYGLVSDELISNKDFFKPFLRTLRFDFTLMEYYQNFLKEDRILDIPITNFLGTEDDLYSINQMQEWGALTASQHETVMFNGNHFYLLSNTKKVAEVLNQKLKVLK